MRYVIKKFNSNPLWGDLKNFNNAAACKANNYHNE
jgi:hypothetical protein